MEILQTIAIATMFILQSAFIAKEFKKLKGDAQQIKTSQRASQKRERETLKVVKKK